MQQTILIGLKLELCLKIDYLLGKLLTKHPFFVILGSIVVIAITNLFCHLGIYASIWCHATSNSIHLRWESWHHLRHLTFPVLLASGCLSLLETLILLHRIPRLLLVKQLMIQSSKIDRSIYITGWSIELIRTSSVYLFLLGGYFGAIIKIWLNRFTITCRSVILFLPSVHFIIQGWLIHEIAIASIVIVIFKLGTVHRIVIDNHTVDYSTWLEYLVLGSTAHITSLLSMISHIITNAFFGLQVGFVRLIGLLCLLFGQVILNLGFNLGWNALVESFLRVITFYWLSHCVSLLAIAWCSYIVLWWKT